MNALDLMKKDHRKVEELFKQIEETTERAEVTRTELFAKIKLELDAHAYMEESVFYPATDEAEATHELTLEAYEEHKVVKDLLAQLDAEAKDSEEWMAKCKVMIENVTHHVKEEEDELFPDVKKVMSDEELEALGDEMEAVKKDYLEEHKL